MRKCALWVGCLLIALGNLYSGQTQAGPLFPKFFHKTPYPPTTAYSHLHYWLPGYYYLKTHHRPFYYEQYTPVEAAPIIVEPAPDTEKEVLPPPKTDPKKEILPPPKIEPKKEILPLPVPEPKKEVPPPNKELQPISGIVVPSSSNIVQASSSAVPASSTTRPGPSNIVPAQPVRFPFLGNWVQRPNY